MARDTGWSDAPASVAAQRCQVSAGTASLRASVATRDGLPSVSVPVLSKAMARTRRACSRCTPPLISRPRRAPCARALTRLTGVAMTRAQGQAITSSTSALYSATCQAQPMSHGPSSATANASTNTTGVYTLAKRSTKACVGARLAWACSTAWMTRASWVSRAAAVTRSTKRPVWLSVPAYTASPTPLSTGRLSPVTGASSMALRPSSTTPSSASRAPGLARTTAPTGTCRADTARHWPSAPCCSTSSGAMRSKSPMAPRARSTARASRYSASAYSAITMAASGHWPISSAPVTATVISALMFRRPRRSASRPFQ